MGWNMTQIGEIVMRKGRTETITTVSSSRKSHLMSFQFFLKKTIFMQVYSSGPGSKGRMIWKVRTLWTKISSLKRLTERQEREKVKGKSGRWNFYLYIHVLTKWDNIWKDRSNTQHKCIITTNVQSKGCYHHGKQCEPVTVKLHCVGMQTVN